MSGDHERTFVTAGILYKHAAPCQVRLLSANKGQSLTANSQAPCEAVSYKTVRTPTANKRSRIMIIQQNYEFQRKKEKEKKKENRKKIRKKEGKKPNQTGNQKSKRRNTVILVSNVAWSVLYQQHC